MQKLEDFHLHWLELASVEVDHATLPDEVVFSLYGDILKYGPNGEAVITTFWFIESCMGRTSHTQPLRSIFNQDELFSAVYTLGKRGRVEDYSSRADFAESRTFLPDLDAYNYLWTQISILAGSLLLRRSLTTADDLDCGAAFQKGLLLFFWGLSGLGQKVESLTEYMAVLNALPKSKEDANAYGN